MSDTVTIIIPRVPPTMNKLKRMHHHDYARLRDGWKHDIFSLTGYKARKILAAHMDLKTIMDVRITVEHKRLFDPDNLWSAGKIPLDCLVLLGFLRGDGANFISLDVKQERNQNCQTIIEIGARQ